MSDAQHISEGLAQARAALQRAGNGVASVPPVDDELDAAAMEAERQHGIERMREQRWRLVCPQRFHRAALDDLDAELRSQIEHWLTLAPRPNLVLLGPVGTGKTHAALAAARVDHDGGLDVLFLPVVELLDLLRPGGPETAIDDVMHASRLIVDDLGHERSTDWTGERLGAVLNRRWLEERPVIATTNLEPAELSAAIGERAYSRLVGDGAVVVALGGNDRRRRRA